MLAFQRNCAWNDILKKNSLHFCDAYCFDSWECSNDNLLCVIICLQVSDNNSLLLKRCCNLNDNLLLLKIVLFINLKYSLLSEICKWPFQTLSTKEALVASFKSSRSFTGSMANLPHSPVLQPVTILVAMASERSIWQPKFWWKLAISDQHIIKKITWKLIDVWSNYRKYKHGITCFSFSPSCCINLKWA